MSDQLQQVIIYVVGPHRIGKTAIMNAIGHALVDMEVDANRITEEPAPDPVTSDEVYQQRRAAVAKSDFPIRIVEVAGLPYGGEAFLSSLHRTLAARKPDDLDPLLSLDIDSVAIPTAARTATEAVIEGRTGAPMPVQAAAPEPFDPRRFEFAFAATPVSEPFAHNIIVCDARFKFPTGRFLASELWHSTPSPALRARSKDAKTRFFSALRAVPGLVEAEVRYGGYKLRVSKAELFTREEVTAAVRQVIIEFVRTTHGGEARDVTVNDDDDARPYVPLVAVAPSTGQRCSVCNSVMLPEDDHVRCANCGSFDVAVPASPFKRPRRWPRDVQSGDKVRRRGQDMTGNVVDVDSTGATLQLFFGGGQPLGKPLQCTFEELQHGYELVSSATLELVSPAWAVVEDGTAGLRQAVEATKSEPEPDHGEEDLPRHDADAMGELR